MKIIGICGPSGAGKSTVSRYLFEKGIPVLDCDVIYHELVDSDTPCLKAIEKRFGSGVIQNNTLDRKALGKIVYSDRTLLNELNAITHKFVLDELKFKINDLESQKKTVCIIDAPLFFEAGLEKWCDFVCAVITDPSILIQRICNRDKIAPCVAKKRVENQLSAEQLKDKVDFIIENNGDREALNRSCKKLLELLRLKGWFIENEKCSE